MKSDSYVKKIYSYKQTLKIKSLTKYLLINIKKYNYHNVLMYISRYKIYKELK